MNMSTNVEAGLPQDDMSFEEAFNLAAASYDETGSLLPQDTAVVDDEVGDVEDNQEETPTNKQDDVSQTDESKDQPATGSADPANLANIDYQQLYAQVKQKYDSEIGLMSSRLRDLSEKYQTLKETGETPTKSTTAAPASTKETSQAVKDLLEYYPDVAEGVKEMIEHRVAEALANVTKTVDEKVRPIQEKVQLTDAERHRAHITAAHPDLDAIVDSGNLSKWVDQLPIASQTGAKWILQYGTAPEVVALLNDFKSTNQTNQPAAQPAQVQQPAPDEDIVKKVLAALSVPSKKRAPKTEGAPVDDYEASFKEFAAKYEKQPRF